MQFTGFTGKQFIIVLCFNEPTMNFLKNLQVCTCQIVPTGFVGEITKNLGLSVFPLLGH